MERLDGMVICSFIEGFQPHAQDLQDRNSGKVGRTVICSFIEGFQRHVQGSAGS